MTDWITLSPDTVAAIERLRTTPSTKSMTQDITTTLQERGQRYGKFSSHALITQHLKKVIVTHTPPNHLDDDQQEALDMICHKIGRIINGDPDYADSWHDIAGYAQLVADRLSGVER